MSIGRSIRTGPGLPLIASLRAGTTFYIASNMAAILAITLYPITPNASRRMWKMLGYGEDIENARYPRERDEAFKLVEGGMRIGNPEPPFRKLPQGFIDKIGSIIEQARQAAQRDRPEYLKF